MRLKRRIGLMLISLLGGIGCECEPQLEPLESGPVLSLVFLGEGTGSVRIGDHTCLADCVRPVREGVVVELSASPDAGSSFVAWGGACSSAGSTLACTVDMEGDVVVVATFEDAPRTDVELEVVVSEVNAGRVRSTPAGIDCTDRCTATFAAGTPISLSAEPAEGFRFDGWTPTELCPEREMVCTFGLLEAQRVGASFVEDVIDPCSNGRLLIIGEAAPAQSSAALVGFLRDRFDVERTATNSGPIEAGDLEGYDVAIIDYFQRTASPEESEVLRAWVEAGHGLISMAGHVGSRAARDHINSLLASLGVGYVGGLLNGPTTVSSVDHPVTAGIDRLVFVGGYAVDPGGEDRDVLGRVGSNPTLVAFEPERGRAVIYGDEWIEFDGQYGSSEEVRSFWANAVDWLCEPR